MSDEVYDREKAREGDSARARLLRAKDETLQFSMDDIHKALEGSLSREKYDQELMPLFLAYMEVTKKLDKDEADENRFNEGIELLKKLQAKAAELGIPGTASKSE
jgi:CII-binding regulator of phage lambda lysogenization HflD